jgi:hypothetical protein
MVEILAAGVRDYLRSNAGQTSILAFLNTVAAGVAASDQANTPWAIGFMFVVNTIGNYYFSHKQRQEGAIKALVPDMPHEAARKEGSGEGK